MGNFSELIKNFDKIRDYMRDFYIYGFKSRSDFNLKSLRSYDNEKRRIEGYLKDYITYGYNKNGKSFTISLDSSNIYSNPLYKAWKSKSFTSNDVMLHFYLLDIFNVQNEKLSVVKLTEILNDKYSVLFEPQTVRLKCLEYANEGILIREKKGASIYYGLSDFYFNDLINKYPLILDAVKFFSEVAPFGVIGSFILDNEDEVNKTFSFKHHYIVHTLEDDILFKVLPAIKNNRIIRFQNFSEKKKVITFYEGLPVKIFCSTTTGRRYLCIFKTNTRRFSCFRLDYIKSINILDTYPNGELLKEKLSLNLNNVWGVGFGGRSRIEYFNMKLFIKEDCESYVVDRIYREGRGGTLTKICDNTFLYSKTFFDANEVSPFIKTFMGRIISIECSNESVVKRFYSDIKSMYNMYFEVD